MRIALPSFVSFLKHQVLYLALSAVVGAIFWAIGLPVSPLTILVYSLCIGNLIMPSTERLHHHYASRPFPYNWLLFLPVLLLLLAPTYVISSAFVWWLAPPTPQSLGHLIRTGWKLPFLVTFVFSVGIFLFRSTKERLERRNLELQRSVELGTARLEVQEQELQRAREIQQSLLPKEIPQLSGFEVSAAWQPARSVSGDYYDVIRLSENMLGICIADVVGKGVSAALLMANVQAAVRTIAASAESPAVVCSKVNRLLYENIARGKFVTFFYGVLDCHTRRFTYCNAGHLYPILASAGSARSLEEGGAVLGVFPAWVYQDVIIELGKGDRLLLFTDGIAEASDSEGREFSEQSIAAFAESHAELPASEMNARLLEQVSAFCNAEYQDDATLVVIAAN
jgi:sigma-B regulation protein RsbU (phosphoserine phosphatase)